MTTSDSVVFNGQTNSRNRSLVKAGQELPTERLGSSALNPSRAGSYGRFFLASSWVFSNRIACKRIAWDDTILNDSVGYNVHSSSSNRFDTERFTEDEEASQLSVSIARAAENETFDGNSEAALG